MLFVVLLAAVVAAVATVWWSRHAKHPERASSHGEQPVDSLSDRYYRGVERPAGPDAEDPVGPDDPRDPTGPVEPPP